MELLSKSHLQNLLSQPHIKGPKAAPQPCISLYVPKEVLQDSFHGDHRSWHHLMKKVENFVATHYPGRHTKISHFYKKIKDSIRDAQALGGVAVFESGWMSGFVPLRGKVQELAIVSDTFHLKPLLNDIQGQNRYYVLTLEGQSISLWEGDSFSLEKKAIYLMPQDRRNPGAHVIKDSERDASSDPSMGRQRKSFLRHEARMLIRFYKEVARRLKKQISRYSDPVYVVAEPSHRSLFMSVNRSKNLVTHNRLDVDPRKFNGETLHQLIWDLASQDTYRKMRRFARDYRLYKFGGRSLESLPAIAEAAIAGKIEALLITRDLHIWGEMDPTNGSIRNASLSQSDLKEDILDDISEAVIAQGGKVYLLDKRDMPENLDVWGVLKRPYRTHLSTDPGI
jgi:hypothetical protein